MPAEAEDDFAGLMSSLRGGISAEEGMLLRRLARQVGRGCIVEVGSFRGKSAVALAAGARVPESGPQPLVYCVEPHRPFVGLYGGEFGTEDRGAFYATMRATGAFRDVSLINLSSEQVVPGWKEPVGLLFIDGDHRYHAVKQDFECWEPHVLPGGIVAFDDATDTVSGACRLVAELLASGRYRRVDGLGKIVVLEKLVAPTALAPLPVGRRRILVACHDIVLTGGLQRFDKVGRVLQDWGHEVAVVAFDQRSSHQWDTGLRVLSLEQACQGRWDMVMVPGAGFPPETIERFSVLRESNFGIRVQHVLNDQTRRDGFELVNKVFRPHIVVFNNMHWEPGSFTAFMADRFHHLLGAVDARSFRPSAYRAHPLSDGEWVIGGLVNKNPVPLIEALVELPQETTLRLYGIDEHHVAEAYRELVEAGRLQLTGPLHGDDLRCFYREVDCVVMTEPNAGWSNLVAEAMASGVPVVCTPHGTSAIARHEVTALVVNSPEPAALSEAVRRLRNDKDLCAHLAERARTAAEHYSWEEYARQLLRLLPHDGIGHYTYAPDLGLHGKWPIEGRLTGLEGLLEYRRRDECH